MTMNANKLTEKAQEALVEARRQAEQRQNTQFEPEHLLAALIQQEGGVVPALLEKLAVQPATLLRHLEATLNGFGRLAGTTQPNVSPRLGRLIEAAAGEA